MKYKKIRFCSILFMLIISFHACINVSYANRLCIKNYINGENADSNKVFEYRSIMVPICRGCDTPFPVYGEYDWHTHMSNQESSCGGVGWYSNDDTRTIKVQNGSSHFVSTAKQTCYNIEILEPDVDDDGNHYQISYQIDDGPLQTISSSRKDGEHPKIIIDNLPTGGTTNLTFYYSLSDPPPTGVSHSTLSIIIPVSIVGLLCYVLLKKKKC